MLNRYCVLRPQYLLVTNDFRERQTSPLNQADLAAAWTVLHKLGNPHIAIYNCGKEAGCSRSHKHLQIFPWIGYSDNGVAVLPENAGDEIRIPFRSFSRKLSKGFSDDPDAVKILLQHYEELLALAREALRVPVDSSATMCPHNVLLTKGWITVIPRVQANVANASANALGMSGLVWVSCQEDLEAWKNLGPVNVLAQLGVSTAS